jgi:predicted DNA-binding transcriptional regulator YafY
MRKATDTLSRQWLMLQKIPAYPRRISTRAMHDYVRAEGHEVDLRTTQRDLDRLSTDFPLTSILVGRTNYWQWAKGAHALEIPSMTPATALVFQLVAQYLRPLMPRQTLELIEPYIGRAATVLKATRFRGWRKNVRMLSRGPELRPPEIAKDVRDVVYAALMDNRQFTVRYHARSRGEPAEYVVNPLGLVVRDGITYVVATLWDYDDVKHLALHRMSHAGPGERPVKRPKGFDLDDYIGRQASFAYPLSQGELRLRARFRNEAAYHLRESSLSADQTLRAEGESHTILSATVPDSSEIRWWLLGFGDQVEVLSPKQLRQEFAGVTSGMARLYN